MTAKPRLESKAYDLNQLKIASPCSANWEGMTGDAKQRFCESCELSVYNISEMTPQETRALIREAKGDRLCFRFFRRADGTVITQDCPVGLAARTSRFVKACAAGLLSLIGFLPGCQGGSSERPLTGKTVTTERESDGSLTEGTLHPDAVEMGEPCEVPLQGSLEMEFLGDIEIESVEPIDEAAVPEGGHRVLQGRIRLDEPQPEQGKVKLEEK